MKTLGDVKVGESSTIVKLHGEGALRRHLAAYISADKVRFF